VVAAVIEAEDLSVERSGAPVVEGIGLFVARGSWFGVIGANGSGKTSLLRALGGRLPFAGGSCRIKGEEMAADRLARARRCGFAPPVEALPDHLRGREVLELVAGRADAIGGRLARLSGPLGLDALSSRWIGDCSAGMRQRIAIAAAFAGGHPIVILDEPFNWLDPVASFDLRGALREMVDDGLTLVTALHDLGTLATACDAGLMLAGGRAVLELDGDSLRAAALDPAGFERRTIDLLRAS
jgi:ABC-2 type transport system ATP-binding protein